MKVLLVWEQIPSSTKAFSLEVDEEELEILERAHKHYLCTDISTDRKEALRAVRARIEPAYMCNIERLAGIAGTWNDNEMKGNSISKHKKLYLCGVMG